MSRPANPATARLWQERLQRFECSALCVRDFCDDEGVSTASFYLWRRRLGQQRPSAEPTSPDFVPVHLLAPAPPLELLLPSGLALRIGPTCEPALLGQLLGLLGVKPC
jgi:hypothetical protein